MIAPATPRPGAYRNGVLQIHITRACDRACFNCTQGSNLRGKTYFISLDDFELACKSLAGYWGVIGIFGGSPTLPSAIFRPL
jgi:molybdenum cofactor biosynthesis enzyme MoaA